MKCVIIFVSCVLAVAYAGYSGHGASSYAYQSNGAHPTASHAHGYAHGGQYGSEARLVDPVAIAAGAPLPGGDTYEVAAAKAAHLKAHAAAKNGHLSVSPIVHGYSHGSPIVHGHGYAHAAPVTHGHAHGGYYGAENRVVDPVAVAAGAPLPVGDTHEVAAAKAAHFKAHAIAKGQAHASPHAHGYSHASSVAHGYAHAAPVAHGYAHAAPVAHGHTHAAPVAHGYAHTAPVSHGYSHTSSVAHEYSHAAPVAHGYAHAAPVAHGHAHAAQVAHGYAHTAPVAHGYAHGGQHGSEARLIDPVAIAAGAPLPGGDTYEVAAAKAAHLKAHAAVKNGHLGLY